MTDPSSTDADPTPIDATASDTPKAEGEREWWDDPALPWKHKPERADVWCLSAMGVVAAYSLVMFPLRPVMLGLAPHLLGSLGYRTGLIMTGALAATGDRWWPVVLLFGALMTIKFHWIYWWAGRRWGRSILDTFARDKSERTKRFYDKAWTITHRYETVALIATFLPIPLPAGVIFAALGAAGTSLRTFLTVCLLSSLATSAAYMYAGYLIGEPAVQFMETYGNYLWLVSIGILIVMIALAFWRSRRRASASATL